MPRRVVSSTATDLPWNATVLSNNWQEKVTSLRDELGGDILIYGSRRLARSLIENGLVDELRLLIYPVVLGAEDRLFEDTQDKIALSLLESRPFEGGLIGMIYAPVMTNG